MVARTAAGGATGARGGQRARQYLSLCMEGAAAVPTYPLHSHHPCRVSHGVGRRSERGAPRAWALATLGGRGRDPRVLCVAGGWITAVDALCCAANPPLVPL